MWRIDLPAPSGNMTGARLIIGAVLTLPYWREGADLKRVDAALRIHDVLEQEPEKPLLTLEELEMLRAAMVMGQNVINQPESNRYYLRVMRAVLRAEEDEGKTTK